MPVRTRTARPTSTRESSMTEWRTKPMRGPASPRRRRREDRARRAHGTRQELRTPTSPESQHGDSPPANPIHAPDQEAATPGRRDITGAHCLSHDSHYTTTGGTPGDGADLVRRFRTRAAGEGRQDTLGVSVLVAGLTRSPARAGADRPREKVVSSVGVREELGVGRNE